MSLIFPACNEKIWDSSEKVDFDLRSEYFSRMVPEQESATEHVVPDVSIVSMFFISSLVTTDSPEG